MSILVNRSTKVIVVGMTGQQGHFHTLQCRDYGTQIVAGVTPGKGGTYHEGIPIFHTVYRAMQRTNADAAMILVPAAHAADSILECIDAGISLVICITEGIPLQDMIKVKRALQGSKTKLIGPNCPGVITPGECKIGIMPSQIYMPGKVGIVSRSGTLTYEVVNQLTEREIGQSTCVGIGGDAVLGQSFIDILSLFNSDPETEIVMMIGEIGGTSEAQAAAWIKENMTKPVLAFIAGISAPDGKRMGHAGALIAKGNDTAKAKTKILESYGIQVVPSISSIGETLANVLASREYHL